MRGSSQAFPSVLVGSTSRRYQHSFTSICICYCSLVSPNAVSSQRPKYSFKYVIQAHITTLITVFQLHSIVLGIKQKLPPSLSTLCDSAPAHSSEPTFYHPPFGSRSSSHPSFPFLEYPRGAHSYLRALKVTLPSVWNPLVPIFQKLDLFFFIFKIIQVSV